MGGQKSPPQYQPGKDLEKSTKTYLKYLPQLQAAEQMFRKEIDPQRIQAQQDIQKQYGTEQYREQLAALGQLDPQGTAIRQQVGQAVSQNLGTAYTAPAALQQAVASQYLGRQVAGGNVYGNAPATGADIYAGNAANQWYQQNLANAQRFLQGPTPEQQLLSVQPVSPDRSSAYVNFGAPAQAAQNNYQNYLAQYQASGGGGQSAAGGILGGALSGASTGATFGPYGAVIGGVAGAGLGYAGSQGYFSDHRLKDHVEYVGESPSGLPIYRFNYKGRDGRYEGTVAQHLVHLRPDAVKVDESGYMKVLYDKIDIDLKQVEEVAHASFVV